MGFFDSLFYLTGNNVRVYYYIDIMQQWALFGFITPVQHPLVYCKRNTISQYQHSARQCHVLFDNNGLF